MSSLEKISPAETESVGELRERLFRERQVKPPKTEDLKRAFGGGSDEAKGLWDIYVGKTEEGNSERFQIWTEEYIEKMSDHLASRVKELWLDSGGEPIKIAEVGAGDGLLTKFLEARLKEKVSGAFKMMASDIDPRMRGKTDNRVERASVQETLRKEKPDIVLSSWMPLEEDWTRDFVDNRVKEYILIGEEDSSGIPYVSMKEVPGFYMRDYLGEVDQYNVDYLSGSTEFANGINETRKSRTYAFRRMDKHDLERMEVEGIYQNSEEAVLGEKEKEKRRRQIIEARIRQAEEIKKQEAEEAKKSNHQVSQDKASEQGRPKRGLFGRRR